MDKPIRRSTAAALVVMAFIAGFAFGGGLVLSSIEPADVNRDGTVNVLDVQIVVNEYLQGNQP